MPKAIAVTPTLYPDDLKAMMLSTKGKIAVDKNSQFWPANKCLGRLIDDLGLWDRIGEDVRIQLRAELKAGRELLAALRADPQLIKILLVCPLEYLQPRVAGTHIGKDVDEVLTWLRNNSFSG